MANIIKPFQLAGNQLVFEQNNEFYYVVTAILGIRLSTGKPLLEFDFFKEAFENMEDNPLPDMGMPKPQAEYIVSGSYYSPQHKDVTAGEVKVKVGDKEKQLFVFGVREWEMGVPTDAEPFSSMPLTYSNAYGGSEYASNPDGMGYLDSLLPHIENPDQLLTSNKQKSEPAGLTPLSPSLPQRMQFQGTYDDTYLEKYYPGYPENFDWRFFMTAAQDQWLDNYFIGNEKFELHNLHPEKPAISGKLPGNLTRCFIRQEIDRKTQFEELKLNLDTVWFFPETDLALLMWRGGMKVTDDEAGSITDVLLAYESASDPLRTEEYYQAAMEKRLKSDDPLLNNFNTADLIPPGVMSAMEILQESIPANSGDSLFSDNLDAKVKAIQSMADEKVQEVNEQIEKSIEIPDNISEKDQQAIKEQLDLKEMLKKTADTKTDAETEELNKKLEAILPGITSGDAKKLNLKEFSFDKIDELMAVIDKHMGVKEALALEEKEKASKAIEKMIAEEMKNMNQLPDEEKEKIEQLLKGINAEDMPVMPPMTRINLEEMQESMSKISPLMTESLQQVEMMKTMGGDDEAIKNAEKMISDIMNKQQADMSNMLQTAEQDFKELYIVSAHSLPECSSPHKGDVSAVADKFIERVRKKQQVSNMDWACIDLSGKVLDGLDLSGAYLEQVDFSNASLKGCNFEGAILARANLNNADCTGANFNNANLGSVKAIKTNFTNVRLNGATLSNSDFTDSIFCSSDFEETQMLDIIIDGVDFSDCKMESTQFIGFDFKGTVFKGALLNNSVFLQCKIKGADYSNAIMQRCAWSDTSISGTIFHQADMTSNCFVATEGEPVELEGNGFKGSCLQMANFQGLSMANSDFSNADVQNVNFSNADLKQSNFSNTNAKQAMFRKATLTHSNFENANVIEGSMSKAHLSGASFKNANLYAVDFLRSTMGDTDFSGANLDNTIIRDWRPS